MGTFEHFLKVFNIFWAVKLRKTGPLYLSGTLRMLAVHRYSFLLEVMWVVSAPSYIMSGGWSFNLPHPLTHSLTHSTLVAFELEESTKQLLNQPLQLIKTVRICVAFLLYFEWVVFILWNDSEKSKLGSSFARHVKGHNSISIRSWGSNSDKTGLEQNCVNSGWWMIWNTLLVLTPP